MLLAASMVIVIVNISHDCGCDGSALLIASGLVRISGSFREILRAPQSS